jgi:hypothetical protein
MFTSTCTVGNRAGRRGSSNEVWTEGSASQPAGSRRTSGSARARSLGTASRNRETPRAVADVALAGQALTNTDNKQGPIGRGCIPTAAEESASDSQDGGTAGPVWTGAVPADNWSDDGSWFLGDVETNLLTAGGEIRRIQLT